MRESEKIVKNKNHYGQQSTKTVQNQALLSYLIQAYYSLTTT